MRGSAEVGGAVTVVNAISTGKGAAIGVSLKLRANAELSEDGPFSFKCTNREVDDSVARTAFELVAKRYDLKGYGCRIEVESEIPVAVGLKSSSAAASAIALALLDAIGEVRGTKSCSTSSRRSPYAQELPSPVPPTTHRPACSEASS